MYIYIHILEYPVMARGKTGNYSMVSYEICEKRCRHPHCSWCWILASCRVEWTQLTN